MASFHIAIRRAQDSARSLPQRHRALRWALESYSWLTRQSFQAIYARLVQAVPVTDERHFSSAELSAATDLLIASRRRFLTQLEQFVAIRRYEKAIGHRRPVPSAVAALYSLDAALPAISPQPAAPASSPPSAIAPA